MKNPNLFGTTITRIQLKNSAFSPISDQAYSINRKRTRNPALDSFLSGVLRLFERYAETFLVEKKLIFKSEDCLVQDWDPVNPFFSLIIAESASGPVEEADIEELRQLLLAFSASILELGEDMFSTPATALAPEQQKFVEEAASEYLRQHKNQTITAPFDCSFPNSSLPPLPIQGKLRPAPRPQVDLQDETFLAVCDGIKADDLSIFIRKLNDKGVPQKDSTDTYAADQESLLRVAAEAYLAPIKAVEVTVCQRLDPKGVLRRYVKAIRSVTEKELNTKISESQLAF